jgi:5-formyltetrahydrofolate cyclo-ligase
VAFDLEGGRLGRGAGYYDRALAALADRSRRPQFVGVGFESQIVSSVPMDSLDMRLDVVVTETGIFVADGTGVNREVR